MSIEFLKTKYQAIFENRNFLEAVIYLIHYFGVLLFDLRIMRLCKLAGTKINQTQLHHNQFDFLKVLPKNLNQFEYNQDNIKSQDIDIANRNNDFLYVAVIKNTKKIVCYGWYSTQKTKINQNFTLQYPHDYVYMYNGYTEPEYRGYRLHGLTMQFAALDVYSKGYQGLVSFVDFENYRSIHSCKRLGYEFFGFIIIFKVFKRYFILRCPKTTNFGINLV